MFGDPCIPRTYLCDRDNDCTGLCFCLVLYAGNFPAVLWQISHDILQLFEVQLVNR